jgi:hypothetical protein
MCANGDMYIYASENLAQTKTGKLKKWFSAIEDHVKFRLFPSLKKQEFHSDSELDKLVLYEDITDKIIQDINSILLENDNETLICIEGYSYASQTSALIDLVVFSTLLRSKIVLDSLGHLMVVSPTTLKVRACEFTYGERFNAKGKKISCCNDDGLSGGRFKKPDILKCLIDNDKLKEDNYVLLLKNELLEDLIGMSNVPKPIEDLNDAKIAYEILKELAIEYDNDLEEVKYKSLS